MSNSYYDNNMLVSVAAYGTICGLSITAIMLTSIAVEVRDAVASPSKIFLGKIYKIWANLGKLD